MKIKKILALTLVMIVLSISITSHATPIETLQRYNVISTEFMYVDTVTRFEALAATMSSAGVTKGMSLGARNLLFGYSSRHEYFYFDGWGGLLYPGSNYWLNSDGLGTTLNLERLHYNIERVGYINLAFEHRIARGEIVNGYRFFYFDRFVTAREVTTFMLRLLGEDDVPWEDVYARSKELGLIREYDSFYYNPDHLVIPNEFSTLLYRFLNQNRYIYFDDMNREPDGSWNAWIGRDDGRSMTYLEFLQQRLYD